MRDWPKLILLFCAGLLPAFLMLAATARAEGPAFTDMSDWSFEQDGAIRLDSGWTVFRGRILAPEALSGAGCAVPEGVVDGVETGVRAPDVWGPAFTGTVSTGHGSATYCRALVLPETSLFYAMRTGTLRSVAAIYAIYDDEKGDRTTRLLYRNGDPANDREAVVNNPAPPLVTLPHGATRMTILIQVSNHIHKQGGMIEVPDIDLKWRLDSRQNRETALPSAMVIVLFLVSIGTLVVGLRHSNSVGHQRFAILTAASALRVMFVSDIVWDYFPSFPLARKYDLEYMTMFLIAPAYYGFITYLFRGGRVYKVDYLVYGICAALTTFALVIAPALPPGTITLVREPVQGLWIIIGIALGYTIFRSYFRGDSRNEEAVIVISAALVTIGYEIMSVAGIISGSLEWSQFLVVLVTLMHMRAFVINSRRIERERDALTASLQEANRVLHDRAIELDLALIQAQEASRAKSSFLATVSHELRTPLNAIIGFSELIARELFGKLGDARYKDYAEDIHDSGNHLLELVNDILDLSRIEAGADSLHEKELRVEDVVHTVLKITSTQAENHKVTCRLEPHETLPRLVADERKLKQILFNLMGNAIKFNKAGGLVSVKLYADTSGFHVEVSDTGIGMAKEDIPTAMTRFGQVEHDLSRKYGGVGIGLPLAYALMQQHGGSMKIDSQPGTGTTVSIVFPPSRCKGRRKPALVPAGQGADNRDDGASI